MRKDLGFLENIFVEYSEQSITDLRSELLYKIFRYYLKNSESSRTKATKIKHGNNYIKYSYQRHDLELITKNWLKFIYNIDNLEDYESLGSFFSCGIASIYDLIISLYSKDFKNYIFSDIPYFESYGILENNFSDIKLFQLSQTSNYITDVLWLDSCSPKFLSLDYKLFDTKIIVFDTSCLDCSSDYIEKLVYYCKEKQITLALVRSHMKLDCFGLEISRLGSLVIINDNYSLMNKIKEIRTCCGNNAILQNIYPWLGYDEFFDYTTKLIDKVKEINRIIKTNIKVNEDTYEVMNFDHELYFTIKFKNKKKLDLDNINVKLSTFCQSFNLPVVSASSFFLDKIGIDNFVRKLDNNSQQIRISASLISKKYAKIIGNKISEFFQTYSF